MRTPVPFRRYLPGLFALALTGLVACTPYGPPPTIPSVSRVSVNTTGGDPNGAGSDVGMSANGRYVAFTSDATNVVSGDTNRVRDVFVRDLQNGTTTRVSVATSGTQGNGPSRAPSISGDGRYVAFTSDATNLVSGDTNGSTDVFVRDTVAGTTSRVSLMPNGSQFTSPSIEPDISADGTLVAFVNSPRSQYHETSFDELYVRDLGAGTSTMIEEPDTVSNRGSTCHEFRSHTVDDPAFSGDNRYIAYAVTCSGISVVQRVVEYDRQQHTFTLLVATDSDVGTAGGLFDLRYSADGNVLAWMSWHAGRGCCPQATQLFLRVRGQSPAPVLLPSGLTPFPIRPSLSGDGRYVALAAAIGNDNDNHETPVDAYVLDRQTNTARLASATQNDEGASGNVSGVTMDYAATRVAFVSDAPDLVSGDRNEAADVFVRDVGSALAAGGPEINVGSTLVNEPPNGQTATAPFPVSVTGAAVSSLSWHTVDGSATAGQDYVAVAHGTTAVSSGHAILNVTVNGDAAPEPAETFRVVIDNPPAGVRVTGSRTATIGGQPGAAPVITPAAVTTPEGPGSSHNVNVTLNIAPAPTQTVSAYWHTDDWEALGNEDYVPAAGVLVLAPGQTTAAVSIKVLNDDLFEVNERFFVNFSDTHGVTGQQGTITITDDDPAPTVSVGPASIAEGDSGLKYVQVPLTLNHVAGRALGVNYKTTDGTAIAGSDYVATNSSAEFQIGDTTTYALVQIIGDTTVEPDETFHVKLLNSGLPIGTGTATVTILNDD